MQKIGFGGGCHWCTEAVFQALRGVDMVDQGWIKSDPPFDTYSEAVIVTFDPDIIPLDALIEVHLRTHASRADHSFRSKYRSAIYTFTSSQHSAAQEKIVDLQTDFDQRIVTNVVPFVAYKPSDERFQNYYLDNPDRPFCKTYIDPKLALIRQRFRHYANAETVS